MLQADAEELGWENGCWTSIQTSCAEILWGLMKKLLLKMTLAHQTLMVHIVRRMEVKAVEVKAMEVKAMEVEAMEVEEMEVEEMEVEEMEVEAMEVKAIIGKDYKPNKQTRSMPGSFAEVHTCAVWTRFGT
jgi:hypothetical protein